MAATAALACTKLNAGEGVAEPIAGAAIPTGSSAFKVSLVVAGAGEAAATAALLTGPVRTTLLATD